ncbi:MAG: DUF1700 domain-containing protein [Lachnospiraceae bacterium]
MNKIQFLAELRKALEGNLPATLVRENESYYLNYIDEQMKSGKKEKEVLEALGDPTLIAKTIIETQGGSGSYESDFEESYRASEEESNIDFDTHQMNINGHILNLDKWYVKLLAGILIVAVLALVLTILVLVVRVALWLAVPVMIVAAIYILYVSLFRRR